MRLIEAIIDANHRAVGGDHSAGLRPGEFSESLPLVALTCIDPRLNPLMPEVLGLPETQFIWLRNAGNIIFDSMSSMTRTLALACALKGGREIAIIGHTDCKVGQTSVLQLTDLFKRLGVERSRLPDNLTEFFGLFASERQNVLRGVEFVRKSPLIGPKIPVHGLVVDVQSGRLEWVANGYQSLELPSASSRPESTTTPAPLPLGSFAPLAEFSTSTSRIGEIHTQPPPPDLRVGSDSGAQSVEFARTEHVSGPPSEPPVTPKRKFRFDPEARYKVMDAARKVFGPISGEELEQWVNEGRIDLNTLAQKLGYQDWRPLETLIDKKELPSIPVPPPIAAALRFGIEKQKRKGRED